MGDATDAVYREMLRSPGIEMANLCTKLGLSEGQVREALDKLADLALIKASWDGGGSARPVSPHLGFQALWAKRQAEIAGQQQALDEARSRMASLIDDYMNEYAGARVSGMEKLTDLGSVRNYLEKLAVDTRHESLAFAPGGPQTEANRLASRPLLQDLLSRSVSIKTIYLESIRNDTGSVQHSAWLTAQGGAVRTVPHLPFRMQIADRRAALIPLSLEDSAQGALIIEEPAVVSVLCALFDMVWATAAPLGEAVPTGEDLSAQERELLRLLAQGLTDEGVARKLGVSIRTERRMVTKVSEVLGAQSRFQLGQRAAEIGLL
ncbi:LuxR C-terminal-related transcriptional regulator [Streptomyces sp. NPDC101490]|uniref:helix-turn-helix transcriptional regulator n=1 Tax=unclassified Streptomyces TaxID=2593676 RepID=UPI003316743E